MIPVRADLSEENLRQLLVMGCETTTLDYKVCCDLRDSAQILELVKDIAAMQILGGYIVIGADDHGNLSNALTKEHLRAYEQASLTAKVRKYLSEPFDLRARHHHLDGHDVILLYVGANDSGIAVLKAEGKTSQGKQVFRPGDVFARHGTASERWNQQDLAQVTVKLTERNKELWMIEATRIFARMMPTQESQSIVKLPVGALNWELDAETFHDSITELLHREDRVPLTLLLSRIRADIGELLETDDPLGRIQIILDRAVCIAALALQLSDLPLFRRTILSLLAAYNLPIGGDGLSVRTGYRAAAKLWLEIMQRLLALGALAERFKAWEAMGFLISQRGKGYDHELYSNWFRHGLTMAARENLLLDVRDGQRQSTSLISFAQGQAERQSCLRPDLYSNDEELLNSLCRFDFLVCTGSCVQVGDAHSAKFYPNFARYHSYRAEPAVADLLADSVLRQAVFPADDKRLALTLQEVDRIAQRESSYLQGWTGYRDEKVKQFLATHLTEEERSYF